MRHNISNQLVPSPKRSFYIDTIGGLLIIRVVLWHCFQCAQLSESVMPLMEIFGFVMLWYFFKGGMFYKYRSNEEVWKKTYKRLLIPCLVFSVIGTLLLCIYYLKTGNFSWLLIIKGFISGIIKRGAVPGNEPLWFLITLMFSRLLFNYLYDKPHGKLLLVIIAIWPIIAHYYIQPSITIPFYLVNIASGTFFFALGHYLKPYTPKLSVAIILIVVYGIITFYCPIYVDMRNNKLVNGGCYLMWYPMSLMGILGLNGLSKSLFNFPNWLSTLGRNTMSCFCLHWIIIILVNIFIPDNITNSPYILLTCYIFANIILIPLFTVILKKSRYKNLI